MWSAWQSEAILKRHLFSLTFSYGNNEFLGNGTLHEVLQGMSLSVMQDDRYKCTYLLHWQSGSHFEQHCFSVQIFGSVFNLQSHFRTAQVWQFSGYIFPHFSVWSQRIIFFSGFHFLVGLLRISCQSSLGVQYVILGNVAMADSLRLCKIKMLKDSN